MSQYPRTRWLLRRISKPTFWLVLLLLVLITIPHYAQALPFPNIVAQMIDKFNLDRHAFERILYLAPIVWAGFIFGWRGAVMVSVVAFVLMLPRAVFFSPHPTDAILESTAVFVVGNVLSISFASLRREREYRTQLEVVAEQLRGMQDNLRFYLHQVTKAQEEERKRISRELHDDTIQALVALSRQLDTLIASKQLSEENRGKLEELWKQANEIMQGVRRLSQDLRPAALDRLGLLPALEQLAVDVADYSAIQTKVNVVGKQRRLSEEVELLLFRIVQEALRNVWRHAEASEAEIVVEFERERVRIAVRDNGRGFQLPDTIDSLARGGKLGLAGMQERARLIGGTLTVESELGKGSKITVEVPSQ